jgi:hypothetical protein
MVSGRAARFSGVDLHGVKLPACSRTPIPVKIYPKLIHYNKLPKGGHFAAFEQPQLLSEEIRVGFRSLRSGLVKAAA